MIFGILYTFMHTKNGMNTTRIVNLKHINVLVCKGPNNAKQVNRFYIIYSNFVLLIFSYIEHSQDFLH